MYLINRIKKIFRRMKLLLKSLPCFAGSSANSALGNGGGKKRRLFTPPDPHGQ